MNLLKTFLTFIFAAGMLLVRGQNVYSNYSESFFYQDFTYSGSGGGFVAVDIVSDVLIIDFSAGFSPEALKTGNVKKLNTTPELPDMDLGYIAGGTAYFASIKSGYIHISGDGSNVSGFNEDFQIDLIEDFNFYSEQNYIVATSPKEAVKTDVDLKVLLIDDKDINISYFDGLGRVAQSIAKKRSPNKKDLVSGHIYDQYGREPRVYLPFESDHTNGQYNGSLITRLSEFYSEPNDNIANTSVYYISHDFEASTLNNLERTASPGEAWQMDSGNEVRFGDRLNNGSDNIYNVTLTNDHVYTSAVTFQPGFLQVKSVTDEDEGLTMEFTDSDGLTICKKSKLSTNEFATTYYIYNELNRLLAVVPPEAVKQIEDNQNDWTLLSDDTFKHDWLFLYKYDKAGRMVSKKVPGASEVLMVYDVKDRLVLTQDGNQRNNNEWIFTKYDGLNRVVYTGKLSSAESQINLQSQADLESIMDEEYTGNVDFHGYSNYFFSSIVDSDDLLQINYYDNYQFLSLTNWDAEGIDFSTSYNYLPNTSHVVATKTRNLKTGSWLNVVSYFDSYNRVARTIRENQLGGSEIIKTTYKSDVSALVTKVEIDHEISGNSLKITYQYTYDHADRLIRTYHKINNEQNVLLHRNSYNALGELIEKNLHSTDYSDFQQSIDYAYNIRGWLNSINGDAFNTSGSSSEPADLFSMELFYNQLAPEITLR